MSVALMSQGNIVTARSVTGESNFPFTSDVKCHINEENSAEVVDITNKLKINSEFHYNGCH